MLITMNHQLQFNNRLVRISVLPYNKDNVYISPSLNMNDTYPTGMIPKAIYI